MRLRCGMRISLRKVVTWLGVAFLCCQVTFNLYYRNVWLFARGSERLWGTNFDSGETHLLFHHSKFKVNSNTTVVPLNKMNRVSTRHWFKPSKSLWPNVDGYEDDRILKQMKFKLSDPVTSNVNSTVPPPLKKILVYTGLSGWHLARGRQTFYDKKCNINACSLTDDRNQASSADVILFNQSPARHWTTRPEHQLWILFMLECPYHTPALSAFSDVINITASYRHDSDIVAPYEKFVLHDENVRTLPQNRSYAEGKTKHVAWFVSNCASRNGRGDYAKELSKYIPVDIYGACGPFKCPRKDSNKCYEMLNKDYKFYLSFENSNCRDYITEKFFVNGLQHDVIPIVMGAAPEDYRRAAPLHSYIHVDDFDSPKELADYLHLLDKNDQLYNEYFQWKGTGHFIDTIFWCRVCAMAHDTSHHRKSYKQLDEWWRGPEVCIGKDPWKKRPRESQYIFEESLIPSI